MKRMHIHVSVDNIDQSLAFYKALFGSEPVKVKTDYAKWMLDDPRLNFAISTRSGKQGLDHLGLQVDDANELQQVRDQMKAADMAIFDEGETVCCYARSDKSWLQDPAGIAWETYHTMDDVELFSGHDKTSANACCTPETKSTPGCCIPSEKTTGCCA